MSFKLAGRRRRRGQAYTEYLLALLIVSFSAYATLETLGLDLSDWFFGHSEDLDLIADGHADQLAGGKAYGSGDGVPGPN